MKLSNWAQSAILLGTLLSAGGLKTAVAQQAQASCRRIRPEAVPIVLAVYGQPDFRSSIVGEVSSGERVYLANRRGVRGADGITYVQLSSPVAGYIPSQYEGIDTLGSCNVADSGGGPSIPALW